jgi:hypothetical protein
MPRKRIGPFKNSQRKWAVMGQKSKYSPLTEDEFYRFMYGYLGKEKFKEFKQERKRQKREKNK